MPTALLLALLVSPSPAQGMTAPEEPVAEYRVVLDSPLAERATVELTLRGDVARAGAGVDWSEARQRFGDFRHEASEGVERAIWTARLDRRRLDSIRRVHGEYGCSYVADDHAMLFTEELFVLPFDEGAFDEEAFGAGTIHVRFEAPEGWRVVTPWMPSKREEMEGQKGGGSDSYLVAGAASLLSDIVCLGDWSTHVVEAKGSRSLVAVAPGQPEVERIAASGFRRILENELDLFGCTPYERYLIAFGRAEVGIMGGSPRTNSMTMVAHPALLPRMETGLLNTFAHEMYHVWVVSRIRSFDDDLRWMNEGFADYYAHLVCARLGLATWQDFADTIGATGAACLASPHYGKTPLTRTGGRLFFEDPNASDLTYAGGRLVAAWLDRALRARTDATLDDFMRSYVNDERWSDRTAGETASTADFLKQLAAFAGSETAAEVERLVTRPLTFDPEELFASVGVECRHEARPGAVPPGPPGRLEGTRVALLEGGSLAQRLGLRVGDDIVEVNGQVIDEQADILAAWQKPRNGSVHLTVLRDEEELELEGSLPRDHHVTVETEPWREHAN